MQAQQALLPGSSAGPQAAPEHSRFARYASEFIGTFFLVFTIGCNVHTGSLGAAISIGSMLMVMIYALGSVSGAHFNPAVTFAVLLSGRNKIKPLDAGAYMCAQIAGGIVGALTYWLVVDKAFLLRPVGLYSTADAVACEIFYSWALCWVVLHVATTDGPGGCGNVPNYFFGIAIGFTVSAAAIAVGPISGCSLNPAVSVGSILAAAVVHGERAFHFWWSYTLAPFAGAVIAYLTFYLSRRQYEYVLVEKTTKDMGAPPAQEPPRQAPPVVKKAAAPKAVKPPPPVRRGTHILMKQDSVVLNTLGQYVEQHNLYAGLSWQVTQLHGISTGVDIDASCVKFDRKGTCLGAVYFAEKKDHVNGIEHSGDVVVGSAAGTAGTVDNERIRFKLSQIQKNVHVLFFVATIFSSVPHSFKDVTQCAVRLIDEDESNKELVRFDKKDIGSGNALIVAMLFRMGDGWCFKAIDECYQIQEHGTYRALEPQLQRFLRQTLEVLESP